MIQIYVKHNKPRDLLWRWFLVTNELRDVCLKKVHADQVLCGWALWWTHRYLNYILSCFLFPPIWSRASFFLQSAFFFCEVSTTPGGWRLSQAFCEPVDASFDQLSMLRHRATQQSWRKPLSDLFNVHKFTNNWLVWLNQNQNRFWFWKERDRLLPHLVREHRQFCPIGSWVAVASLGLRFGNDMYTYTSWLILTYTFFWLCMMWF